jgi:hypothetical protein
MKLQSVIVGLVTSLVLATSASADDGLLPGEVDLGLDDSTPYTGYTSSDLTEQGPGMKKVRTYDYVCPGDSKRPSNGVIQIEVPNGQCMSRSTGTLVSAYRNSDDCYERQGYQTSSGGDSRHIERITLGTYQCFSPSAMRVVEMVRKYRGAYHIVGDEHAGVQDSFSHGAEAAAKAAGKTAGGIFSSCTGNPFSLCAGGPPDPDSALRACFDFLCP